MKIFRYTLIVIGIVLIIYNTTKLDFENLLEGESEVAVIGIFAALCAIILMLILNTSLAIRDKKR